jgi:hypothetical protein
VPDVIEAVLDTYRDLRPASDFIDACAASATTPSSWPPTRARHPEPKP